MSDEKSARCEQIKEKMDRLKLSKAEYREKKYLAENTLSEKRGYLDNEDQNLTYVKQELYELEAELSRLNTRISELRSDLEYADDNEKPSIQEQIYLFENKKSQLRENRTNLGWKKDEINIRIQEIKSKIDEWQTKYNFASDTYIKLKDELQIEESNWDYNECGNSW